MNSLKIPISFDIIGPVMIGPSSSHTAGAVRIGKIVSSIFGEEPKKLSSNYLIPSPKPIVVMEQI